MDDMVIFYPEGHEAHFESGHPERPERVEILRKALLEAGWWDTFPHAAPMPISSELLGAIHTQEYLDNLQAASERGAHLDMDTYTTTASWELALNAVGGAVQAAESVWSKNAQRGLALTRPPGHHATSYRGMGFCLLNNVAIAAEYLLSGLPDGLRKAEKVAIVDLDLHHGNGTQDIFWRRDDVLYISTHQFPHYPGTGQLGDIGAGPGEGFTANVPLPPGTGDQGFQVVMDELILPALDRYKPEILLISFGFDPHWRDPLGHLLLSAAGYGVLISRLTDWADENCEGKISLFLEGGYDLDAGEACIQAAVAALLGQAWSDPLGPSPRPEGGSWRVVVKDAHKIWKL